MTLRRTLVAMMAVAAGLLAGCGDDGEAVILPGLFTVSTTGAFNQQLNGVAAYGIVRTEGVDLFTIQLTSREQNPYQVINLIRGNTTPPTEGTYGVVGSSGDIDNVANEFAVTYTRTQQEPFMLDPFAAISGSVTITDVTGSLITGTLNVVTRGTNGREVRISGTFSALQASD